jgi:dUTP pyrophosphatase
MKDSDLNENKEDFDFDLDSTLDRLHEELKELSRNLEENGDNELSNLSEKLGVDFEKLIETLSSSENSNIISENVFDGRIRLNYVKIHPDAVDPKYNYGTDSCFDLHSVIDYELGGFQRALIPTGLKFDIPAYNELQVRTKSGLAINQGLVVLNSPGTIDSGYNGEIKVIVYNTTSESIFIKKQQKIAQCGLYPVYVGSVVILQQLDSIQEKDRGENGFGSTGI